MSENTNNGYVVEGDLNVAVKGQLVIYSITGGTMLYSNYIQQAKNLDLTQKYVPLPRRPDDAFAKAKDNLLYYFVGIDKARFKKPVYPGDVLIIKVNLIQSKKDVHKFTSECKVNDELVCTAELLGAVRSKNDT